MRESFEKWVVGQGGNITRAGGHDDRYAYPQTATLWHGWQAAYAAGLTRAAEIAEAKERKALCSEDMGYNMAITDCADAIRAEIKEGV